MDVDLIFKIAAVGIVVAVLNVLLTRSGREEQALMTTLAGLVVVLMLLVREISALFFPHQAALWVLGHGSADKGGGPGPHGVPFGLLLRRHTPELGLALSLGACVTVAMLLFGLGQELRQGALALYERTGLSAALVEPVVKCVGLGLVGEAGRGSVPGAAAVGLAGTVETAGAAAPCARRCRCWGVFWS